MKSIDFRTNWIPDFLPIGSLWLETSATALRGPYVINWYKFTSGGSRFLEVFVNEHLPSLVEEPIASAALSGVCASSFAYAVASAPVNTCWKHWTLLCETNLEIIKCGLENILFHATPYRHIIPLSEACQMFGIVWIYIRYIRFYTIWYDLMILYYATMFYCLVQWYATI